MEKYKHPITFDPIKTREMNTLEKINTVASIEAGRGVKWLLTLLILKTQEEPLVCTVAEIASICNLEYNNMLTQIRLMRRHGLTMVKLDGVRYMFTVEINNIK